MVVRWVRLGVSGTEMRGRLADFVVSARPACLMCRYVYESNLRNLLNVMSETRQWQAVFIECRKVVSHKAIDGGSSKVFLF